MTNLAPYTNIIRFAKSFRYQQVVKTIIEGEQQRAKNHKMMWKIGTGAALALMGVSADGFDRGDLLLGAVGAAAGGLAHDQANKEHLEFLNKYDSLWLEDGTSPANIARRLGEARSRIFIPEGDTLSLYNHHRGTRGEYMIALRTAGAVCEGFQQPASLEVLSRNFSADELSGLRTQLWPQMDASLKIDSIRAIKQDEAEAIDSRYIDFIAEGLEAVAIEINGEIKVGYRSSIPMNSDY